MKLCDSCNDREVGEECDIHCERCEYMIEFELAMYCDWDDDEEE